MSVQESSGGWGHSNSGPNALNYVELEVMSTLALGAIGALQRALTLLERMTF